MTKIIDRAELMRVIEHIPLLSPSTAQLLQLSASADHDLKEIVDVVRYDSALTGHVLRVVNSAAFGLRQGLQALAGEPFGARGQPVMNGCGGGQLVVAAEQQRLDGLLARRRRGTVRAGRGRQAARSKATLQLGRVALVIGIRVIEDHQALRAV